MFDERKKIIMYRIIIKRKGYDDMVEELLDKLNAIVISAELKKAYPNLIIIVEEEKIMLLFKTGKLMVTNGVDALLGKDEKFVRFVQDSFNRHCNGDWGDLDEEDKAANEYALRHGERLFSKYDYNKDVSIYITTEWDRSVTTILFPEEY